MKHPVPEGRAPVTHDDDGGHPLRLRSGHASGTASLQVAVIPPMNRWAMRDPSLPGRPTTCPYFGGYTDDHRKNLPLKGIEPGVYED